MLTRLPFDLHGLEMFLAVCESGSMAAAARALGVTQPAVSQAMAEIEGRIGTLLFDRSCRPAALTAAGAVLRQSAATLLADAGSIAPRLREVAASRIPVVRLGLVDSLNRALLATLAGFLRERVEQAVFLSGLTASHAASLLTRQLDVAAAVDDLGDVDGLERALLLQEPYLLVAPEGTEAPADVAAFRALALSLPFVRYSARSLTGAEIERHLRRLRIEPRRGQEFDAPGGVLLAARAGGVALTTPLCLFEAGLDLAGVACHPLPGPLFSRRLTLVWRRGELGTFGAELAARCRAALHDDVLPSLAAALPRFRDMMTTDRPA